ncbi:MAG: DUF1292 domain-containing protein [Christensenellaceae bacterium]|jgi:uncharacterized protein YrzB (UPF0473 family)|nr:DUF1292 domain-containing protein [Christensenellaceae bacterium]
MESLYDVLLDTNNKENITLFAEDGREEEFAQVAVIKDDDTGKIYTILQPVKLKSNEVVVFELIDDEDESVKFVEDEALAAKILDKYKNLL